MKYLSVLLVPITGILLVLVACALSWFFLWWGIGLFIVLVFGGLLYWGWRDRPPDSEPPNLNGAGNKSDRLPR